MKESLTTRSRAAAFSWVVSSNFAEGVPYAVVTSLVVAMYADLGLANGQVTAWTGLLALPWSLKALWSPFINLYKTKRWWMLAMPVLSGVCFFGLSLALGSPLWFPASLVALAVAAMASASYDVACDGFYMQVLTQEDQSFFVGIRSTAYRLSLLFANGGLITLVGWLASRGGTATLSREEALATAWAAVLASVGVLLWLLCLLHGRLLPRPVRGERSLTAAAVVGEFRETVRHFFHKRDLLFMILFLLAYRLGEALLGKVSMLFLKDTVADGGLGLDNAQYGVIYGVAGVTALMAGGVLGGMYIARRSLARSIVPMALALNLPDLLYVWMAAEQPQSLWVIGGAVAVEQFGYGFGLTAYMVYMLQSVRGRFATAHYALLTCVMALGMTLPGILSGWMEERLGYCSFFIVTCLCTLPGLAASVGFARRALRRCRPATR